MTKKTINNKFMEIVLWIVILIVAILTLVETLTRMDDKKQLQEQIDNLEKSIDDDICDINKKFNKSYIIEERLDLLAKILGYKFEEEDYIDEGCKRIEQQDDSGIIHTFVFSNGEKVIKTRQVIKKIK